MRGGGSFSSGGVIGTIIPMWGVTSNGGVGGGGPGGVPGGGHGPGMQPFERSKDPIQVYLLGEKMISFSIIKYNMLKYDLNNIM